MSGTIVAFVYAALAAAAIYFSAEAFTNGVEWLGRRLNMGQTATGTVLAAMATGLPEGVVTLVATAFGHDEAEQAVGIGAALGGPLVLSTIAYGVVGLTIATRSRGQVGDPVVLLPAGTINLRRTQSWFIPIFAVTLLLGTVQFPGKGWLGLVLLLLYAAYVVQEMRSEPDAHPADLEPLLIRRQAVNPRLAWIILQVGLAVGITFWASALFVDQLATLADGLAISPQLAALILSPIATELPETMNAILWCRQGRVGLALANIGGAMIVQTTVPAACGLLFTSWRLDRPLLAAGLVTLVAAILLRWLLGRPHVRARTIGAFGLFYVLFIGYAAIWR